jgi:type I restriction enzyme S subunit
MELNQLLDEEIPNEWSVSLLKDICRVINGRAYREGEYKEDGTPIIRIQNLSGGKKYLFSDLNLPQDKYVEEEELLFAWSATFGPFIWRGVRSIYHYHIWKLDCFKPYHKLFLYSYLKQVTSEVSDQGSGSIFRHITKALMESQLIIYPSDNYSELYNKKVAVLFEYISIKKKEIQLFHELIAILQSKMATVEL